MHNYFIFNNMYVTLRSSTCFEQHAAHHQENQLYNHSLWSPPAYCTAVYRGWRYQRLWWYNLSSWGWAACCLKHVKERSVIYILLKIKELCIKLVIWKSPHVYYDARSEKPQITSYMFRCLLHPLQGDYYVIFSGTVWFVRCRCVGYAINIT